MRPDAVWTAIWRILRPTPERVGQRLRPYSEDETLAALIDRRGRPKPTVTMPQLGGLPTGPIREVRVKNHQGQPATLGGVEVAGRRAGPGFGPPLLVF